MRPIAVSAYAPGKVHENYNYPDDGISYGIITHGQGEHANIKIYTCMQYMKTDRRSVMGHSYWLVAVDGYIIRSMLYFLWAESYRFTLTSMQRL